MQTFIRPALSLFLVLSALTGLAYPALVTGLAQLAFPGQAQGSLVERDGRAVGSSLIGQPFSEPRYFWSRPSATSPNPNNGLASGGSNLAATNPALTNAVAARIARLKAVDPHLSGQIPTELVTASASGLDPHISPKAAYFQVPRVARLRGLPENVVRALVDARIVSRQFGFLGEPTVNVLDLNLALDRTARATPAKGD